MSEGFHKCVWILSSEYFLPSARFLSALTALVISIQLDSSNEQPEQIGPMTYCMLEEVIFGGVREVIHYFAKKGLATCGTSK